MLEDILHQLKDHRIHAGPATGVPTFRLSGISSAITKRLLESPAILKWSKRTALLYWINGLELRITAGTFWKDAARNNVVQRTTPRPFARAGFLTEDNEPLWRVELCVNEQEPSDFSDLKFEQSTPIDDLVNVAKIDNTLRISRVHSNKRCLSIQWANVCPKW
jgi:hypothetical protein